MSSGALSQISEIIEVEIQKALNFVEPNENVKQQRLKALLTQYRLLQKELARL